MNVTAFAKWTGQLFAGGFARNGSRTGYGLVRILP
jgi:hypothetical protein